MSESAPRPVADVAGFPAVADSVAQLLAEWAQERPDLDFSPVGVVSRMERIRAYLDAGQLQVYRRFELTPADFRVIVALRRSGPPFELPQSRLMSQLALTSGTVSVRVDRLTRSGIVTRSADPRDRRGQLVRLTAEGLQLFDQIAPIHLANLDRLMSGLTAAERETLTHLLSKLLVSFESGGVQAGLPLGMRLEPAHVARSRRTAVGLSDTPGLLITDTIAGTPAAVAGLIRGDLIVAINGAEAHHEAALAGAIAAAGAGAALHLSVLRGNDPMRVTVDLPAPRAGGHRP